MRYKLLGKSGLRVSELCLGTMTFGEDWGFGAPKEESKRIYDAFLEAGGNFIDTANLYTNGTSELFLGELIASERERIVLATKYTNSMPGNDPNRGGNHRKNMVQAVEQSLKRLKTDYIDLYWLHIWDFMTPIEEVMRAFDDLVRAGKILYAGISDAPAWVVSRANTLAELRGWTPFVGLQIEYSLIERTPERDLIPMAKALEIGVTPWSPLAGGTLTGKYRKSDVDNKDGRYHGEMNKQFAQLDDRAHAIVDVVSSVAKGAGRPEAQVALNWLRQQEAVVSPIIGARTLKQVKDNLACLEWSLSAEQIQRLSEASQVDLGFPGTMFAKPIVKGFAYAGMYDSIDRPLIRS